MVIEEFAPADVPTHRPLLDRRVDLGRVNLEWIAYGALLLVSIGLHLWQLGYMAMAHDESIHAWMSWKFFTGRGGFNCAWGRTSATYCYDPVYHGPTLYFLTLLSYFLFGDRDATARLPQALAGVALIPACYLLRPLLGKRATLLAAVLVTLSPSLLYFSRYARHDALVLLWTLLMFGGLFRWIREGHTRWLALAAGSLALAWATHELVFILIFIGVTFLTFRLFWEWQPRLFTILALVGISAAVVVVAGSVGMSSDTGWTGRMVQRLLGPAIMGGVGALLAVLLSRSWPRSPVLLDRLRASWATRANADPTLPRSVWGNLPPAVWWALGTFVVTFSLLFSTFLAYPRGILDGLYAGINHWWFSQHEYARGGQPWYYYLMLLPVYELMALLFAIGGTVALAWGYRRGERNMAAISVAETRIDQDHDQTNGQETLPDGARAHRAMVYEARERTSAVAPDLFVSFLAYWWVLSLIAFSWAGEKMPWLLIHTALPVTLLAAWVLAELIGAVAWRTVWKRQGWSVPPLVIAALVLTGVAAYYLSGGGATVTALRDRLRALPALALLGATIFGLITIAANVGGRTVLRLAALSLAGILLLYGIRTAVHVVYVHPDVPVEPLIYTQTSPDVPILVDQIRRTAISQTRNERTKDDPTGGLSMKVVADPELAWPFQWYLRDFRSVCWINFEENQCTDWDAPVVLLYEPSITPEIEEMLEENHVRVSQGVLNWWFPENGSGSDGGDSGQAPRRGYKDFRNEPPWVVLSWPFRPQNWPALTKFMIYREVPQRLEGRDMQVFIRRESAPVVGGAVASVAVQTEPLVAEATLAAGQLQGPRGLAVDAQGNILVADAMNHRVVVFDPAGTVVRTIGSRGSGDNQLYEPSGVAVDAAGNIYVADTWNARIAKFGPDGAWITAWGSGRDSLGDGRRATDTNGNAQMNAENPLGFYGPRNVLVVDDRVYVADTGNKRVVVTDLDGTFLEQLGTFGTQPGQFHEPIGLGTDSRGRVYVGDTWNGRIQIFARDADGSMVPQPEQVVAVSGWEKGSYNDPYLATTPEGRMLVALAGRNAVGIYSAAGTLERRLRAERPQVDLPKGLAVAPDGTGYVVDGQGAKIVRFRFP